MANSLTDGYDIVVHIRTRNINGVLANFHRSGGTENRSPSFPHSFEYALGGVGLSFDEEHLLTWVQDFDLQGGLTEVGSTQASEVSAKAPPGLSTQIADLITAVQDNAGVFTRRPDVKGKAQIQVSSPRVEFVDGSTSTVIVVFKLRAYFITHKDSVPFPRHVHGEVRAVFHVSTTTDAGGTTVLHVTPSANDHELAFTPYNEPGVFVMSPYDVSAVSEQVRQALRGDFAPVSVELDAGFPFQGFKALGDTNDPHQALALALALDGPPPAAGLGGVHHQFLKFNDDFGVGVSKEFVEAKLATMIDALSITGSSFTIQVLGIDWATYVTTANEPQVSWSTGEIEISVTGSTTTTNNLMPDYHWSVQQRLKLVFDTQTQDISLVVAAPLQITGLDDLPSGQLASLRSSITTQRDNALQAAQGDVDAALTGDFSIGGALQSFDNTPTPTLTAVELTPQGVILRGQLGQASTSNAQVDYRQASFGGFSALWSWMPGGWINEYRWSWKLSDKMYTPWGGTVAFSQPQRHTFRLPPPANKPNVASVCLVVTGEQTTSDGSVVPVEGGEACKVSVPSWMVATMPKWYDLLVPIWEIDPSPDANVEETIKGHINLLSRSQPHTQLGGNSLVHFTGDAIDAPLHALSAALSPFSGSEIPIALTLVLPPGSLNQTRAALERRLGELRGDFSGWLMFTEDFGGAWSRAFAPGKGPETFAMNARGEFVWRHAGVPNRRSFGSLAQHLMRGCPLTLHTLELGIARGERGPDFLFRASEHHVTALRRLRGRRVQLVFWKSWSTPCLQELRRLRRDCEDADGNGPMVIAVNGGESAKRVEAVRRELGLTFPVVVDTQRRLARQYDVHCWPTTVWLDEDGRVDGARFGATRSSRGLSSTA